MTTTALGSRSLRQLLGAVSADLRTLGAQILALARVELHSATAALVWSAVGLSAAIVIGLAGVGVLVSALVLTAIALGLPPWAAATLIGFALTVAGALSARYFVGQLANVDLSLSATRASITETLDWLRGRAKS